MVRGCASVEEGTAARSFFLRSKLCKTLYRASCIIHQNIIRSSTMLDCGFGSVVMRKKPLLNIRPFSNLWHALWTSLAFIVSIILWITVDAPPVSAKSYSADFMRLVPAGTVLFAILAVSLWVAWWRERRSRLH